jgi:hypothetical protein
VIVDSVDKVAQMIHPLVLASDRVSRSATSTGAGAIGAAMVAPVTHVATPSGAAMPGAAAPVKQPGAATDSAIRPFRVDLPQAALDDLRRRLLETRWPDRETVSDRSQGARLEELQALVRYWSSAYDWRKAEAKLNALPQFVTSVDGDMGTASFPQPGLLPRRQQGRSLRGVGAPGAVRGGAARGVRAAAVARAPDMVLLVETD